MNSYLKQINSIFQMQQQKKRQFLGCRFRNELQQQNRKSLFSIQI